MSLSLPPPITAYFEANARFDVDAMLLPFSTDAIVIDEKQTRRGREAIREWIEEAAIGNRALATPRQVARDGDDIIVEAEVSGAFAGSPVTLSFRFGLDGDRITRLEIA